MTETTVGREPVQIVEIQQPLCSRTYGVAPCTASGGADRKCYNTFASCQDPNNFALGTPLTLYFSRGNVADMGVSGVPYIIPSLVSVSTAPTRINLAGSDGNAQGIGNRAVCSIVFRDHQHSDRIVDPYIDGRSWNALSGERGSFWTRWMARNKYRQNIVIKVYEGYAGQALAAMTVRTYFMQSIQGPDDGGNVTIQGKDILAKVEERKAQAPLASNGVLYAALTSSATSFEATNAVLADYPATGTLRIGDEIVTYTSRATSTNGVTFSGVTRGTNNTTAVAHNAGDGVQLCLKYTAQKIYAVLYDLLVNYSGIDPAWLDYTNWTTEVDNYLAAYTVDNLITKPTAVSTLISEIQEQCLVYMWWDERTAKVKLKAIRGVDQEPTLFTDATNIISATFALSENPSQRVSQIWVYYNRYDYINDKYRAVSVNADLASESDNQFGEPSIRTVYANWLSSDALAANTGSKIITRYVGIPSQVTFRVDAKDRATWVGDIIKISHYLDVNTYGERNVRQWLIVSAEDVIPGEVVEYTAEDITLYGQIYYIMPAGSANYPGASLVPFKSCYIGNSLGKLSDGNDCGKIS